MKEYIYDNFAEDSWDYVSEKVVSDDFWDNNLDLIKEITFDLYRLQSMLPLHLQYEREHRDGGQGGRHSAFKETFRKVLDRRRRL